MTAESSTEIHSAKQNARLNLQWSLPWHSLLAALLVVAASLALLQTLSNLAKGKVSWEQQLVPVFIAGLAAAIAAGLAAWRTLRQNSLLSEKIEQLQANQRYLAETENLFQQLVKNSTGGVIVTDEQGVVVGWNPALEAISGLPGDQALGRKIWEIMPLTVPEQQASEPMVANMKDQINEINLALSESEAFNRAIIDAIPAHIAVLDSQGWVLRVNASWDRFARAYPQSPEAAFGLGANYLDLFRHPDGEGFNQENLAALEAVLQGQHEMHELELLCTRCAQERWLLIRATPLRNGRSGMVISHLDITARKQAEVAIQNSKQEWEATFDAVDSMVILTDPNGAITRLNRATCDRLCSAFKELIGLTIAQVFFGEHPYNPELFRSGSDAVQLPNLPGWFSIACYPLQVAGISAGWVNILTDISQKKETMDALERNARELETLYRTSLEINAQQDLNLLLNIIVEQATKLANANVGGLYLYRPEEDEMELVVGHNFETNLIGTCLKRGEGLSGRVLESGEAMMIPDYSAWEGRSSYYNQNLTRRVLAVPMKIGARVIGAINVSDKQRIGLFSEEEIRLVSLMADQAANAVENTRLLAEVRRELAARIAAEARLQRQFRRLAGLRALDAAITTGLELRLIMNLLLVQTRSQLEVDAADVLLLSNDLQTLELTAGEGFDPDMERQQQMNHGEGLAWQSVFRRSRVALDLPVERHNGNPYARQMAGEGFIAYISVPLVAKGQVKGVLEVFQRGPLAPEQEWLEYLETLAGQGAIAIDNAEMFTGLQRSNLELQAAYEATIEGWSQALELRDKETKGHSDRVTRLTEQLAIAMGIKGEALLQFRHGVRLHDIGKMGIPDSILLKPGPLTDEEWIVMRQHPVYAYNLLKGIPYLEKAIEIPYSHHEKWDGSGYPRGLKGEEIPLSARIFSVVDVWDALVSDRPYRKAWTAQAACEYLQAQVNIHFDPQVVATFLPMIQHVQI